MSTFPAAPASSSRGETGRRSRWTPADLSMIAVFAALIAAFSLLPGVPLGSGVPITLQTFAVMLTGILLGPSRGTAAVGLYLLAALAGLPVFSGFRGDSRQLIAGFLLIGLGQDVLYIPEMICFAQ